MSQGFKLRFDQMRENDPTGKADETHKLEGDGLYQTPGHARSLCLIWPDGKRMFFNYSYLASGQFETGQSENVITLLFGTDRVVLKGFALEALFTQLMDHYPRYVIAQDRRYVETEAMDNDAELKPSVFEINVEKVS